MIHDFADNYQKWYNRYRVEELVSIPYPNRMIVSADDPLYNNVCFKVFYRGIEASYNGLIVTNGVRYAYIVDNHMVNNMVEPQLNLWCRARIREAIRKFLDELEMWPL